MTVRTRFSPSPTGMIHLGNVRAALFNALFAKRHQGVFILRIEDTDVSRSDEQFIHALQEDLHWLSIMWQEGPGAHGDYGPYWQSQRQDIYVKYYTQLEEKQLIYPCFCTDQELALARKLQISRGQAPRYQGTCRKLSSEDIAKRLSTGEKPAWRFAVPSQQSIDFVDTVKGPQHFFSDDIGDFIIRRADGTAPFLFCNAIDDAEMCVSHVLRGEDHLANTPRQILLLNALQLHAPLYGHLSLIVGGDGAPLSKRHGSFSVQALRGMGFLPAAILNYLARLGHTMESQDLLSFDELAERFQLEKLSRSPARFDENQLKYWQKCAVQKLDTSGMWHWLGEPLLSQVPEKMRNLFLDTVRANIEFPHDALLWAKIFFHDTISMNDEDEAVIRAAGEQFFVEAEQAIEKYGLDLQSVLRDMKKTLGISGQKLYMPLRIALTGRRHGPELAQIANLLGLKKVNHRIAHAFKVASAKAKE